MKKEIRALGDGVVRITTVDERWYAKASTEDASGLPVFKFLPSVTWILSVYPKLGLMKLRDEVGAEASEALMKAGGARGSKVHAACSAVIEGKEVRVDSAFDNGSGFEEELTAEEVRHVMSFVQWVKDEEPEFLVWDTTVYSEKHGYAGTLDFIARLPKRDNGIFLVDIKTSKVISTDYAMQVSAYRECVVNLENEVLDADTYVGDMKLAILQLGQPKLKTNPAEYRWKEVEPCFDLFLATKRVFEDVYETQIRDEKGASQRDYPMVLSAARGEPGVVEQVDVAA